jgi:lipid-A-disaccharide synthase
MTADILVCAGEVSGDRLAAPVVAALRRRDPTRRFYGWGGRGLELSGVELLARAETLAVTGAVEAAARAPAVLVGLLRLALRARRRRPRLALLVDYPGVNLRLGRALRRLGVPVLYLGAPQRWAWLADRTRSLRDALDRLVVCLPFEERWFVERGVPAVFLGHPLLDAAPPPSRERSLRAVGLAAEGAPVLCLLPGSRVNELERHLPPLREAMRLLGAAVRPLIGTTAEAGAACCAKLAPELAQAPPALALAVADAALCASGTASLETALAGVPAAVFYRMAPLSYALARRLVRVPFIGLPNLILDEELFPELIQDQVTPERLAATTRELLRPVRRAAMRPALERLRAALGPPGAAERIADLAESLIQC